MAITFPNFIIVFGHAWLKEQGWSEALPPVPTQLFDNTLMTVDWIEEQDMPQWRSMETLVRENQNRQRMGQNTLPSMGRVHMKALREGALKKFWLPGLHQTIVWLGHGQPSLNAWWEREMRR